MGKGSKGGRVDMAALSRLAAAARAADAPRAARQWRERRLGGSTFGAASAVRKVDVAAYLAERGEDEGD